MSNEILLAVAAFFAGAINSVAGGGTFLTFPALLSAGIPPVNANATSTFAVFPGSFSSAFAYRKDFKDSGGDIPIWALVITSLVGGWIGAAILLATPQQVFVVLIPWLLLSATALFAFGKKLGNFVSKNIRLGVVPILMILLVIGFYGGYFGAGMGIMTLALLSLLGLTDLNKMNALKTLATGLINVSAVIVFVSNGAIFWRPALIMAVCAIAGGYLGADLARKVDQKYVRWLVLLIGVTLTAYFFCKQYGSILIS